MMMCQGHLPRLIGCISLLLTAASAGVAEDTVTPDQAAYFEKRIRPVLVEHCQECHGSKKQEAGLRLDSRAALLKGSDTGPVVIAGKPDESLLIEAINHTDGLKMPPRSKLPETVIADLTEWVRQGLPWPQTIATQTDAEAWRKHWAFQPVRMPSLPDVANAEWASSPIDRFVLAKLNQNGLRPAARADARTLLRRASFALTGLPPEPDEISRLEANFTPETFAAAVDRLLASPHYGERWGRHWLDVARYADNKGYVFFEEQTYPWAYTYRDWVVRSLNEDLPYDQFVIQQLAADRLDLQGDRAPLAALGFLTVGGHFVNNVHDIQDDRIDVVTRGLMGLTVTCARCHDHKFDPIPQADYYSLYGVFRSSTEPLMPPALVAPGDTAEEKAFEAEMQVRLKKLADFVELKHRNIVESARTRMAEYLLAAHATRDKPSTEDFMLISNPEDLHPMVILRWWVFLERTRRAHDPIWSVWHEFAGVAPEDFSAKSPALCIDLRLRDDPQRPVNQRLVAAIVQKPPQTMNELAAVFAQVIQEADAHWQAELKQAADAGQIAPTRLADADEEQLRQVFYAADAPANVPLMSGWGFLSLLPDRPAQAEYQKILKEVEQWSMTGPGAPPRAMVLEDLAEPYDPTIFLRGNPNRAGAAVPRQFLGAIEPDRKPFQHGSGRLELARQIVDPANPLTARVLVNRVWAQHFGEGLVKTPSDFGTRSEAPSHPELLDWLAASFMKQGWSLKWLQREIVLSQTWQQSGTPAQPLEVSQKVDPENRLLAWRAPQRLDFESMRDSLLAVTGTLDRTIGGKPVDLFANPTPPRRSLYGFIDRLNVQSLLRTFDVPSPDTTSPGRDTTMVPAQALYLMNGPLAQHSAALVLKRADIAGETQSERRVERLYRLFFGRLPTPDELQLATTFLGAEPTPAMWEQLTQGLLLTNEFVFID